MKKIFYIIQKARLQHK